MNKMRQDVEHGVSASTFGAIRFSDKVERCVARYAAAGFEMRRSSDAEVAACLADAGRTLSLASGDTIARVRAHNPDVFQSVIGPDGGAPSAVIAYLPLNEAGVAAIISGRFEGTNPDIRYLCQSRERPEAIYIWLAHAPGVLGRSLAAIATGCRRLAPGGCPVYSRAVTPHAERLNAAMGFMKANSVYAGAPDWLLVALPERAPTLKRKVPAIEVRTARNIEDIMRVVAVRASTYLAEQFCLYEEEFDGNDFCATQFLGLVDGDAGGCVRLRWFGDFAKLERLAVRREYRSSRLAFRLVRAALDHARAKGFTRIYGHSRADLVPFWQVFGFRVIPDRAPFRFANVDYREILLEMEPAHDAVRLGVDPMVSIRPEGAWDRPGPLDRSNLHPDHVRAAMVERSMRKIQHPA